MQSTEPTTTIPLANLKLPNTETTTTPPLANLKLPNTELTTTGVDTKLCHGMLLLSLNRYFYWWTISPLLLSRKCFGPDMVYEIYILTLKSIPSVFMYAMNIQNDVIGLVLRENCKSKQMTDIIA